jgi:hypothetical protein
MSDYNDYHNLEALQPKAKAKANAKAELEPKSEMKLKSKSNCKRSCIVYVCVEQRDPGLMSKAYEECRNKWGFHTERIKPSKIRKALEKAGVGSRSQSGGMRGDGDGDAYGGGGGGDGDEWWSGVEIWKLQLRLEGLEED